MSKIIEKITLFDTNLHDHIFNFKYADGESDFLNILEKIFNFFSILGDKKMILVLIIIFSFFLIFIIKPKKSDAQNIQDKINNRICVWSLWIMTIINILITSLLKILFSRARPGSNGIIQTNIDDILSFPSGHATISIMIYGFLIYYLFSIEIKSRWAKICRIFVSMLFVIIILGVGFSRIYLEKHYFSDVIAGYILGLLILLYGIIIIKKYKFQKEIENKNG